MDRSYICILVQQFKHTEILRITITLESRNTSLKGTQLRQSVTHQPGNYENQKRKMLQQQIHTVYHIRINNILKEEFIEFCEFVNYRREKVL